MAVLNFCNEVSVINILASSAKRTILFSVSTTLGRSFMYNRKTWGNLRERDHLGDPGVDGRIILRWIFRKWDVGVRTGSIRLRIGTGGAHL